MDKTSKKKVPQLRSISGERSGPMKARESWHILGIISEFVESTEKLASIRPAVSIFGSARLKAGSHWYEFTVDLSRKLSDCGFSVISGGGPGIMEAANKGAHAGKSPSIGLNILLPHEQSGNPYQDISLTFRHFFPRKVAFAKYAAAFIGMPGGFGTLDELSEVLTLIQTKVGRRIPVILVGASFWKGLIDWIEEQLVGGGMVSPEDMELIQIIDDPQAIVDAIFDFYDGRGFTPAKEERETIMYL
jgi:uncharacterized protein (TIGR00730 family)